MNLVLTPAFDAVGHRAKHNLPANACQYLTATDDQAGRRGAQLSAHTSSPCSCVQEMFRQMAHALQIMLDNVRTRCLRSRFLSQHQHPSNLQTAAMFAVGRLASAACR